MVNETESGTRVTNRCASCNQHKTVERLRAALDDLVEGGCEDGDGRCQWCDGELEPLSCGQPGHVGCMGYSYYGGHDEDCEFIAALELSRWGDHKRVPATGSSDSDDQS